MLVEPRLLAVSGHSRNVVECPIDPYGSAAASLAFHLGADGEPVGWSMSRPINTSIVLRSATLADAVLLEHWNRQPQVIAATTDDQTAEVAFGGASMAEELASQDDYNLYFIAELDGRPIGAMQMIDPHLEHSHYWGKIAPNLRALDIWIGEPDCLGKGYGETMMRLAFRLCFADATVTAVVIDPLASNVRAHEFYRRLGFRPVGHRRFGNDDCLVHELTREDWRAHFKDDAEAGPAKADPPTK